MCRELEETGLNKPQYYVNAFMLTAIVYNNFMDLDNVAGNAVFEDKKEFIAGKTPIGKKNERLVEEKATIDKKNERLVIENETSEENRWMIIKAKEYYNKGNITATIYYNLFKILTEFSNSDIIGRKEIREKLGYGDSKAARAIDKMLELRFLTTIPKAGKGKYRFKNENEE